MSRAIQRFVGGLQVSKATGAEYRQILKAFEAFEQAIDVAGLSVESLRSFLAQGSPGLTPNGTINRLRIITRYVAWRTCGARSHSLLELTKRYGGWLAPIAKALLQDDYEDAFVRRRDRDRFALAGGPRPPCCEQDSTWWRDRCRSSASCVVRRTSSRSASCASRP